MKTIAIYLRVSMSDSNEGESESITNQRNLLLSYVKNDTELSQYQIVEFVDDGWSGTNFQRPEVMKMLSSAGHTVNIIIVKDFSRFGRNLSDVGDYLDQVFPFLGVRFIAVNEHFDSNNYKGRTVGIDVGLKALIHQLYSQDLSCKSTSARISKQKEGYYLNALPPYGYMKPHKGKSKLIPNLDTAPIVERIFKLAIEGKKPSEIAVLFNKEAILTPNEYRMSKNIFTAPANATDTIQPRWTYLIVRKIIMNEIYYGTLISRKNVPLKVGSKKSRKATDDEIITYPNAHEPIVSKEDWDMAQNVFRKIKTMYKRVPTEKPLIGILKCSCCGRTLGRNRESYRCNLTHVSLSKSECRSVVVNEEIMENTLKSEIDKQYPKRENLSTSNTQQEADGKEQATIGDKLKQIDRKKQLLFENLVEEKITSDVFKAETETLNQEQCTLLERSQELLEISRDLATGKTVESIGEDIASLFKAYIDYVTIFPNGDYEISWK